MLTDAHTHIHKHEYKQWLHMFATGQVRALVNTSSALQWHETAANIKVPLSEQGKQEALNISFGIHPWNSGEFCSSCDNKEQISAKVAELIPFYEAADAIGEIGMDSIWCNCNPQLQRWLFEAQLEIANALKKPVILHTKGMEQEIAEALRSTEVRKLVHWYSCEDYLEDYILQDCYFSVGPGFINDPAVMKVIKTVPMDRLLVETDGADAVGWVLNQEIQADKVPLYLQKAIETISQVRSLTADKTENQIESNFYRFLLGENNE